MTKSKLGMIARLATLTVAIAGVSAITPLLGGEDLGPLSSRDKAMILASQGAGPPAPCFRLANLPCVNFDANGNFTPCGANAQGNCAEATTNACSTNYTTWECPADNKGNLKNCPQLPDGNDIQKCGVQTQGGTCFQMQGGCGVIGARDAVPAVDCGRAHNQPTLAPNQPVCNPNP